MKDWISITLSILALTVSLGSTYFTIFRETDDLRVIINVLPMLSEKDNRTTLYDDQDLTFINSGNRAAAVTRVALFVSKPLSQEDQNACTSIQMHTVFVVEYAFEPFVLRPGEIMVRKLTLPRPDGKYMHEVKSAGRGKAVAGGEPITAGEIVRACVRFTIATPDNFADEVWRLLFVEKLVKWGADFIPDTIPAYERSKPVILLKKSGTVFRE